MTMAYARSDIDPFPDEFLADPFPPPDDLRNAAPVVYLERYWVFWPPGSPPGGCAASRARASATPCAAWTRCR